MRSAAITIAAVLALGACTGRYTGPARPFDPAELREDGWVRVRGVPALRQERRQDCGLAAARMVLAFWQKPGWGDVRIPDGGLRAHEVRELLRQRGLRAFVIEGTVDDLTHELDAGRPVIVGTVKAVDRKKALAHFEVVVAYHPDEQRVVTIDPGAGWRVSPLDGFLAEWRAAAQTTIVAMP